MTGFGHWLRHVFKQQPIVVVSEWRDGQLWIGARCTMCGQIGGWHDASHVLRRSLRGLCHDGGHFCPDWDFAFIHRDDAEMECCTCNLPPRNLPPGKLPPGKLPPTGDTEGHQA